MKLSIFVAAFSFAVASLYSKDFTKEDLVAASQKLKAACAASDLKGAAAQILYVGPDKARRFKAPIDYKLEGDQKVVERVCGRISRMGEIKAWGNLESQKKRDQTWFAISFTHLANGEEKKNLFAFLVVGEKLYLGDID